MAGLVFTSPGMAPPSTLPHPNQLFVSPKATCLDDPKCYAWGELKGQDRSRFVVSCEEGLQVNKGVFVLQVSCKYDANPNVMQNYSREMHGNALKKPAHVSTYIKLEIVPTWEQPSS